MDRNEIISRVTAILAECLSLPAGEITLDSHIDTDLGADSLDAVEMLLTFEDEFDIEVTEDALGQVATVGDIVDALDSTLNPR